MNILTKRRQPETLDEAILYLLKRIGKVDLGGWTVDEFINRHHFDLGMKIRNDFKLWAGSKLARNLAKQHGAKHPDDMSTLILKKLYYEIKRRKV